MIHWLFHTKYNQEGPIGLDKRWIKKPYNLSKTEAVVITLARCFREHGGFEHSIWMDNLFTSSRLLLLLRDYGFGGSGTVRQHGQNSKGFDPDLFALKKDFGDSIDWGKLYGSVDKDNVYSLAWKDQGLVLFMSTIVDPHSTVIRQRKRPSSTATSAATSRRLFGSEPTKALPIPEFIDMYNHYMNAVDRADQLRSYYTTTRAHFKGWKSLWHWLLDLSVVNAYRLSRTQPDAPNYRQARQFDFRQRLIVQIMAISERTFSKASTNLPPLPQAVCAIQSGHEITQGSKWRLCKACTATGRTAIAGTKRKALGEISQNTLRNGDRVKRPPRTTWGCEICQIPLCNREECWNEHLEAAAAKRSRLI